MTFLLCWFVVSILFLLFFSGGDSSEAELVLALDQLVAELSLSVELPADFSLGLPAEFPPELVAELSVVSVAALVWGGD